MKNIILKMLFMTICMFGLSLYAQVPPKDKEMADELKQQRMDSRQNETSEKVRKGTKEVFNYVELQIQIIDNKSIVLTKEFDFSNFSNDEITEMRTKSLMKLRELMEKDKVNLVSELGSYGIKIVSHSFQLSEKGEKHIYILEL